MNNKQYRLSFGDWETIGDAADDVLQSARFRQRLALRANAEFKVHELKIAFRRETELRKDRDQALLHVATYNIDAFGLGRNKAANVASVVRSIKRAIQDGCEILCLQEVTSEWMTILKLEREFQHQHIYFGSFFFFFFFFLHLFR